ALAVLLFLGWEGYVSAAYGASHFVLALKACAAPLQAKVQLLPPLIGILGGTTWVSILFALAALGYARRTVVWTGTVLAAGFLAVVFVPERYAVLVAGSNPGRPLLTLNTAIFGTLGAWLCALAGMVGMRLCRRGPDSPWSL